MVLIDSGAAERPLGEIVWLSYEVVETTEPRKPCGRAGVHVHGRTRGFVGFVLLQREVWGR